MKKGFTQSGFTLIEIMIAVFILSIAIVGTYGAFSIMVTLTTNASDRLIASYLAQEGIEIVRNIRDTNWLANDPDITFNSNLADENINCENGCEADYTSSPYKGVNYLSQWVSGNPGGSFLNLDANGFYSYSPCDNLDSRYSINPEFCQTNFKRKITITLIGNGKAMKVVSKVYWKEKPNILNSNLTYPSIEVEEILYDWY